jgi:hypothetical protein
MLLHEALNQTATGTLRRIASAHGTVFDDSTTRAELIDRLVDRLGAPEYLTEQLASASDDERAVLALARRNGGEVRGLLVDRDYPGAAEALADRGLLYRVFAAAGPLRGEIFAAPEELLARLPPPPAEAGPVLLSNPPAPADRRVSDPAFSLFCLASALGRRAHLEQDVRGWSEEPGGWDWEVRWKFLQHLAESAGLLMRRADGDLAPGRSLSKVLDDPHAVAERLRGAYRRERSWIELAHLADFSRGGVAALPYAPAEAADLAAGVQLRSALLGAVGSMPEQAWMTVDAVNDWFGRERPEIVREQLTARGVLLLEATDWSSFEKPLIVSMLLGPMYWLALTATSTDGKFVSRRGGVEHRRPAERCVWNEPAELVAAPRAALGTLLEAERYLVLRERGRPSRYHLVQSHVAAALGSGGSMAECRGLLERLTQGPLPEVVEQRLLEWERRFGALQVRPAVVVEARTSDELDAALANERVRSFVRKRVSPTVAEIAAADALDLAAALRESGHLPRVDAALRLGADARGAAAGLIDEQVLEFLLVSLLAFEQARPEQLASLEGSASVLERLRRQFSQERLVELRAAAARLAGELGGGSGPRRGGARSRRRSGSGGRSGGGGGSRGGGSSAPGKGGSDGRGSSKL